MPILKWMMGCLDKMNEGWALVYKKKIKEEKVKEHEKKSSTHLLKLFLTLILLFCHTYLKDWFYHALFVWVCLPSSSNSRLKSVFTLFLNKTFIHTREHACIRKPVMRTSREILEITSESVWDRKRNNRKLQRSRKAELETDTSALQLQHSPTQLWSSFT